MTGTTKMIQVGKHRLEATVFGDGQPVVVIEPGFGGSAEHWVDIAETIAEETAVVTYDRAPYGASSPATDARTSYQMAVDLRGVLDGLGITGPLVLVGHSSGGRIIRAFAAQHGEQVAGMVLVDSSHEAQQQLLVPHLPRKVRLTEWSTVPRILFDREHKLSLAGKRSMAREFRGYQRQTAADKPLAPGALGDKPLIVLTRGPGDPPVHGSWQIWHDLHQELAQLSANHRHVVADSPEHFLHLHEPALVTDAIRDVLQAARTTTKLT